MRWWLIVVILLVGLALGLSLPTLAPRVAGPYLPAGLKGDAESVGGSVVKKRREPERLLLTVSTPEGAILATFKKKATEIELLVDEGDEVTLRLRQYHPFVDDPVITRVMKKDQNPKGMDRVEKKEEVIPPKPIPGMPRPD
ncbi:MAG: hypothetical protein ACE5NA_07470 [Nitrospiraceae bacterium]